MTASLYPQPVTTKRHTKNVKGLVLYFTSFVLGMIQFIQWPFIYDSGAFSLLTAEKTDKFCFLPILCFASSGFANNKGGQDVNPCEFRME
ncbi:hypothetical protein ACTXT7_015926 [Hymenolepis weldensis]